VPHSARHWHIHNKGIEARSLAKYTSGQGPSAVKLEVYSKELRDYVPHFQQDHQPSAQDQGTGIALPAKHSHLRILPYL